MRKRCRLLVFCQINRLHKLCFLPFHVLRIILDNVIIMLILIAHITTQRLFRLHHLIINYSTTSESGNRLKLLILSWIHLWLARESTRLSLTHIAGQLSHLHLQLRNRSLHRLKCLLIFLTLLTCLCHKSCKHLFKLCWCSGILCWSLKLSLPHVGWLIRCCRCILTTLRVAPLKSWMLALILIVPLLRPSPSRIHKIGLFCSRWLHVTLGR